MRTKTIIKILSVVLCVLVVTGGILIVFAFNKYQEIKADPAKVFQAEDPITTQVVSSSSASVTKSEPSASQSTEKIILVNGKQYKEKTDLLNILFVGIDTNKERRIEMKGYRSDMLMICTLDMKNYAATLISIPRDIYTKVCKVDENTGKVTETVMGKINTAYSYGHGMDKYSFQNAIRAVEDFMNMEPGFALDIRYFAGMDIDGIPRIASALGGVTITLEEGFPGIGSKGQTVTLKGQNAIDYVRERKGVGGDFGRTRRQQLFVMSIAKKIQKMGAMQAAPKLFDQVTTYTKTNFTIDEVVGLAIILDKMDVSKIKHLTVEGDDTKLDGNNVVIPNMDNVRQIMLDTYFELVS